MNLYSNTMLSNIVDSRQVWHLNNKNLIKLKIYSHLNWLHLFLPSLHGRQKPAWRHCRNQVRRDGVHVSEKGKLKIHYINLHFVLLRPVQASNFNHDFWVNITYVLWPSDKKTVSCQGEGGAINQGLRVQRVPDGAGWYLIRLQNNSLLSNSS